MHVCARVHACVCVLPPISCATLGESFNLSELSVFIYNMEATVPSKELPCVAGAAGRDVISRADVLQCRRRGLITPLDLVVIVVQPGNREPMRVNG